MVKKVIIPSLKANRTITNLDLRENQGYSEKAMKLIALCLMKNIDTMKNAEPPITHVGKNWLNPAVLLFTHES